MVAAMTAQQWCSSESRKGWPRSAEDIAVQVGELLSSRPDLQQLLAGKGTT
jgi:hypothetical protein